MSAILACALSIAGASGTQETPASARYLDRFLAAFGAVEQGALDEALAGYESCVELAPESPTLALHLACLHARRGSLAESSAWLSRAIEWGFDDRGYLEWEPDLATLRASAGFQSLLELLPPAPERMIAATFLRVPEPALTAWSPDGLRAVASGMLWDVETRELYARLDSDGTVPACVAFHPSGREIFACAGGRVSVWEAASGAHLADLEPPLRPEARELEFSADGRIVLCHGPMTRGVWDTATREQIPLRKIFPSEYVRIDPLGECLLFTDRGYAALVEIATGTVRAYVKGLGEPPCSSTFRSDGRRVGIRDSSGNAWLLDVKSGELLRRLLGKRNDAIARTSFDSRDGSWIIDRRDGRRERWEDGNDQPLELDVIGSDPETTASRIPSPAKRLQGRPPLRSRQLSCERSMFFPDGTRAGIEASDGSLRVVDLGTGRGSVPDWARAYQVHVEGFAPDGSWMLTSEVGVFHTRDTASGMQLATIRSRSTRMCPVGDRLLVQAAGHVKVLAARTGEELATLDRTRGGLFAWRPDGKIIAGVHNATDVVFWDSASGKRVDESLTNPARVSCIAFDPSGERIAVAMANDRMCVWDLGTRQVLGSFGDIDLWEEYEGGTVQFSVDGRFLLASFGEGAGCELIDANTFERRLGDWDLNVRTITSSGRIFAFDGIYDLATGASLGSLPEKELQTPLASPDESRILAERYGATVVLDGNARELYSRAEYEEGAALVSTPSLFYDGAPAAVRQAYLLRDQTVLSLDTYAPQLCDPRRIRAAAAGVPLVSPALPDPPGLCPAEPTERRLEVEGNSVVLAADAEDPRGVLGFELALDGQVLPGDVARASFEVEDDATRARLQWRIVRRVKNSSEVRIRAIARSGILSKPWRVSIVWH
jgi:WD40 repeat protein